MAKSNNTDANTVDAARVTTIANLIRAKCLALSEPAQQMADAQDAIQELSAGMNNTRLAVASEIAALAETENWTPSELKVACDRAAKGNDDDRSAKTVGVFISEMKTFASPKVRAELPLIIEACQTAWQMEADMMAECETKEERANLETPVHKFKSRFYHLVMGIARAVKSGDVRVESERDIVDYAIEHDPDHDEDKIAARLKAVIATLAKIHADFGMAEVKTATDYLTTITAKELLAARKVMLAADANKVNARLDGHRLAPVPPGVIARVIAAAPVPTPSMVPSSPGMSVAAPPIVNANPPDADTGMATGAFDILNDPEDDDATQVQTNELTPRATLSQMMAAPVAAAA